MPTLVLRMHGTKAHRQVIVDRGHADMIGSNLAQSIAPAMNNCINESIDLVMDPAIAESTN